MKLISIVLAALLLAPALLADETAQGNTDKFLEGLKEIDKSIFGSNLYAFKYKGRRVGSMKIDVAESTYELGPCYRVDTHMEISVGEKSMEMKQCALVSPSLQLIHQTQTMSEPGVPDEHETYQLTPEGYVYTRNTNEKGLATNRYDAAPRMIEELAELLFVMLLPLEKDKAYETTRWSKLQGAFSAHYAVEGETKVGDVSGQMIRETYLDIEEEDNGKTKSTQKENTYLVGSDHKILRLTTSTNPFTLELDDGRYSKEEVELMANALDPVLAFWMALRDKDVDLLKLATNEKRYVDEMTARQKRDEDMSEWEKEFVKKALEKDLCEAMLKNVDMSNHLKLMVDGITAAWFEVTKDGDNKAKVSFSPAFAKETGDKSVMWWYVEKNSETGLWEMTYFETDEDEF